MIEILIVLLVLGAATVVFYPVLAGTPGPRPSAGGGRKRARPEVGAGERGAADRALLERKERLLRNLRELDAERSAGRLLEPDYVQLRGHDEAEAARVIRELETLETEARAGRRAGRKALTPAAVTGSGARLGTTLAWVGGIAAFGVLLGITMSRAISPRAPGGAITGTVPGGADPVAPAGAGGGPTAGLLARANGPRLAQLAQQIKRDSTNVKALLEAGHLYLAEQRLDEAAQVTLKALALDPEAAEGHAHIAVLLMAEASSQQDPDSARRAISGALEAVNHAIQIKPDLAEAWLFKGMIMMAGMRDAKGAAQAWTQYLKVAPAGADTMRIHAMLEALRRSGKS